MLAQAMVERQVDWRELSHSGTLAKALSWQHEEEGLLGSLHLCQQTSPTVDWTQVRSPLLPFAALYWCFTASECSPLFPKTSLRGWAVRAASTDRAPFIAFPLDMANPIFPRHQRCPAALSSSLLQRVTSISPCVRALQSTHPRGLHNLFPTNVLYE